MVTSQFTSCRQKDSDTKETCQSYASLHVFNFSVAAGISSKQPVQCAVRWSARCCNNLSRFCFYRSDLHCLNCRFVLLKVTLCSTDLCPKSRFPLLKVTLSSIDLYPCTFNKCIITPSFLTQLFQRIRRVIQWIWSKKEISLVTSNLLLFEHVKEHLERCGKLIPFQGFHTIRWNLGREMQESVNFVFIYLNVYFH
jgi:hypothetical protein